MNTPQRPMRVYKDPSNGTWFWACRVPFCGGNDWAPGGQPGTLRAAREHLDRHRSVGFSR